MAKKKSNVKDLAKQIVKELTGASHGVSDFIKQSGATFIYPFNSYKGGITITYPRDYSKNGSNTAKILVNNDNTRTILWYYIEGVINKLVDQELYVSPIDLKSVWQEHTACDLCALNSISNFSKLKLGTVIATFGAYNKFKKKDITACVHRHSIGDWGDIDEADKKINDVSLSVSHPHQVISIYKLGKNKTLMVCTDAMRKATVAMLPDES